jgi:hypothetical protein
MSENLDASRGRYIASKYTNNFMEVLLEEMKLGDTIKSIVDGVRSSYVRKENRKGFLEEVTLRAESRSKRRSC